MSLLSFIMLDLGLETTLTLACIAVFWHRRRVLVPVIRGYVLRFLGLETTEHRVEEFQAHLESLDDRASRLEGKTSRLIRLVVNEYRGDQGNAA